MRLFTAIAIPEEFQSRLAALLPPVVKGMRPVAAHQIHLTLHFIGDPSAQTLRVTSDPPDSEMFTVNAYWFAWHAMHPVDALYAPSPPSSKPV